MTYNFTLKPRFSETDGLGHINNTVFAVWLEASRDELFRVFNPNYDLNSWTLLVVRIEIDYRDEVLLGAAVEIESFIKKIGNSSIQISERLSQDGRLCAESEVTYVNVNPETKRPERIDDSVRRKLIEKQMLEPFK